MAALQKSTAAQTYQLEARTTAKGVSDKPTRQVSYWLVEQEELLFDVTARIKGKDAYLKIKGALASLFEADPVNGLEMMQIGTRLYVHGPVPTMNATENKWYVLDYGSSNVSLAESFTYGFNQGLNLEMIQRSDLSLLQTLGKQTLHGKQCDIYGSTNANVVMRAFGSSLSSELSPKTLKSIDTAEFKFWVCADGYFHQMTMAITATTKDLPSQKVSMHSSMAMFDYNGSFAITAPQNAVRLDSSALGEDVFTDISGPTATVFNGGNIRQTPDARGAVLGQLHANQTVALIEATVDGVWYHVNAPEGNGWVHVSLLKIPADVAPRVPVNGLARLATPPSDAPAAQVINGGNRRAGPGTAFEVAGQVRVGEQITLLAKTTNRVGTWYYARCRCGALGWVHASLLKIEPRDAVKIPNA